MSPLCHVSSFLKDVLLFSCVASSGLVSSCLLPLLSYLFLSWLCSWFLLSTLGSLFSNLWRAPKALLGASWGLWGASWGPLEAPGPFLAASGPLLGASWAALGVSWASLGPPLGPSWPLLGCPYGLLGLSWGALERSGRLQNWFRLKTRKSSTVQHFSWFFEPPGPLLEPPGGLLVALEAAQWLRQWPWSPEWLRQWPLRGPSGSGRGSWAESQVGPESRNAEGSETRAVFIV